MDTMKGGQRLLEAVFTGGSWCQMCAATVLFAVLELVCPLSPVLPLAVTGVGLAAATLCGVSQKVKSWLEAAPAWSQVHGPHHCWAGPPLLSHSPAVRGGGEGCRRGEEQSFGTVKMVAYSQCALLRWRRLRGQAETCWPDLRTTSAEPIKH